MAHRVRVFQHVPFEGCGTVQPLLEQLGVECRTSHLYAGTKAEIADDDDALIVLGGPMSVHDTHQCRWLADEKALVGKLLEAEFPMLGICLGAQMMADALGARVTPMGYREIGWHPVVTDPAICDTWLGNIVEARFEALHWHGETFDLPAAAIPLGSSAACSNQGFLLKPQQLALQFHLEFDQTSVERLVRNCADELDNSPWVQSAQQMLENKTAFRNCRGRMNQLVEAWIGTFT